MPESLQFLSGQVLPGLSAGLWLSVKLIVPASLFGIVLGITTGALRVYGPRWVIRVADFYVAVFRGTPLVVQLYFWYFALPHLNMWGFRILLTPEQAAVVGFAMCSAAYQSEYIRGGLLSIKSGQIRAAQALGMTPVQAITSVVLPQAVRRALPGVGNEIIYLIKYSSLASIIAVNELTGAGREIAKATWRNTEVFFVVGLYYLALVTIATFILHRITKATSIPGFESHGSN